MIRSDEQIKLDVVDHLSSDPSVDASEVRVDVSAGGVTLSGTVPMYTARAAATAAAWEIVGVKEVNNLLTVRFPATFAVPADKEIQDSASMTLTWNPDIDDTDIDISVRGGVIEVQGAVDAYWKRWKVENLVSGLAGVMGIENHLTVVPSEKRVDKDIATDIEAALERSLYVNAEDVTVRVQQGEVRLTGSTLTYYGRMRAYEAAANTPGVIDVDNDIVVV
jgi:osmotically-inducible protein OsmY